MTGDILGTMRRSHHCQELTATAIGQEVVLMGWVQRRRDHGGVIFIDLRDLEYDIKTGEGVVIVNWGTLLEGKLVLLLAGSRDYQDALLNELKYRL